MKKFLVFIMLLFVLLAESSQAQNTAVYPKRLHKEAVYQQKWCSANCGVLEYELDDKTRVDCLTKTYAIEFDFANKVYESIGQALYYGLKTNKKAGVVLIMENQEKEQKYLKRLLCVAKNYGITVWIMTPEDLQ